MGKKIILLLSIVISVIIISNIVKGEYPPPEISKGIADAWYSEDGVNWVQATTEGRLKLGQPFYVKTYIKAKKDLNGLGVHIRNLGNAPYDFQLVEKPDNIPDYGEWWEDDRGYMLGDITFYKPKAGDEYTFIWKCRVNPETNWLNASAPIQFYAGFTKDGTSDIKFTIADIYIVGELWEGYVEDGDESGSDEPIENDSGSKTPGFELILIILAICITIIYKKKFKT